MEFRLHHRLSWTGRLYGIKGQCTNACARPCCGADREYFQATTQIQEQTLAFVPKIAAVMLGHLIVWTMDLEHAGRFHLQPAE